MSNRVLVNELRTMAAALTASDVDDPTINAYEVDLFSRAAAALEAQEWQPIETAPMDGAPFIGAFFDIRWADSHRKHDVVRCWWQPEFSAFISSCREMTLAQGYAFGDGSTRQLHSPQVEPVTHWVPLPAPPVEAE